MRQVRAMLVSRYPGTRINVSGGTDLSGASTAGGGGGPGGGGGGGGRQPAHHAGPGSRHRPDPGLRHQLSATSFETVPGLVDVNSKFQHGQPELRVEVDRVRAADLGVSIDSLASNLRTLVGGEEVYDAEAGRRAVRSSDCGSKKNSATTRQSSAISWFRPHSGHGARERRGAAQNGQWAHQHQPLQPPAPNQRVKRGLDGIPLGEAVAAAQAKIAELNMKPGYRCGFRRQRPHARNGVQRFRARDVSGGGFHLHGAGIAVQQPDPSADHHDGIAA